MRKRIMRGGGFSVLLMVGSSLWGCFSPDLGLAVCLECRDNVCPGDLVCQEGFCVQPGSPVQCLPSGEGGGGGDVAGAGQPGEAGAGAPNSSGSSGGGASGYGGESGEGGKAGDDEIRVVVEASGRACTTRDFSSAWSVRGGTGPYTWTLIAAPAGFQLRPDGERATVEGVPGVSGTQTISVRVEDAGGNQNERDLTVSVLATPTVSVTALPDVCPDEIYAQDFAGNAVGDLTWSVSPEFVAQTGLDFEGNRLGGWFNGESPETYELAVTVANQDCEADPVELTLTALEPGHPVCPRIIAATDSEALPQPCAGDAYEAEVFVDRGSGDYSLEAVAVPEGMSFDVPTQTLSGISNAPGALTLRVADENGHTVERSLPVEPRESCWLAYLSDETGISRLHLFDPELDRRHVFPNDDSHGPVVDFAFSPDGRALALRSTVATDADRVQLLGMASLELAPLAFEAATAYAWSEDSSTLAVAYATPNGRYLGGASLGSAAPGVDPTISALTPVEAAVDGALVWFADSSAGYLTDTIADLSHVATSKRGAGGFEPPDVLSDYYQDRQSRLRPGVEGLFAFEPNDFPFRYYPADGSALALHEQVPQELRAMAPSGLYLAKVDAPVLELFVADRSSLAQDDPRDTKPGCDAILAWARGRERIACATADEGGRVSIFDVNTTTDQLEESVLVVGGYTLSSGAHTQRWRGFSNSGRLFAFTTDDWLYVATVENETASLRVDRDLAVVAPEDDSNYSELKFSPDEQFLAIHRSRYLRVVALDPNDPDATGHVSLTDQLRPSARCEDDFTARTGPYCAAEFAAAPYAWSGDSRWLVYQEETGTLIVMDLQRRDDVVRTPILVGEPCSETCPGGSAFAFQPPN